MESSRHGPQLSCGDDGCSALRDGGCRTPLRGQGGSVDVVLGGELQKTVQSPSWASEGSVGGQP